MQVRIIRRECCGSAVCAEMAPEVFAIDSQKKAIVLDPEAATQERLIEVAEACPFQAILIEDDEGNPVYP